MIQSPHFATILACLLAGQTAVGCTDPTDAGEACQVDPRGALTFSGPITHDSAQAFIDCAEASEWTTLTINSPGGDENYAYRMARSIRDRDFTLIVDGLCASACAIYLLPAAERVIVAVDSLIAYHPSVYTTYRIAEASGLDFPRDRDVTIPRVEEHYDALGLDLGLFDHIGGNHQVRCISMQVPFSRTGFGLRADVEMWVPTKAFMERYLGRPLIGYPEDRDEVVSRVAALLPGETTLAYGGRFCAELDLARPLCEDG